jgi:hypothetical protein
MGAHRTSSPAYDADLVERAVLEEVIGLLPARLTVSELSLRIVADPEDCREAEAVAQAICDLRRSGLLRYRNDDRSWSRHTPPCAPTRFSRPEGPPQDDWSSREGRGTPLPPWSSAGDGSPCEATSGLRAS